MGEQYDPNKDSTFLMYLDANNLYGYAMMQPLPYSKFEWCNPLEFTRKKILTLNDEHLIGYIFEVDLDYPVALHDDHDNYPFCAEKMKVPGSRGNIEKLLLTLNNKRNYVIHQTMLKMALQQGLELKKIHRVLSFRQDKFLKPYIELNTSMRQRATNEFEKNFYKLMSNAIYGKNMENVRGRIDLHLVRKWKGRTGAETLIKQPNFKRCVSFSENFVAIEMSKVNIIFNKPIAIGMAVLDISKMVMYNFYYNHLKNQYNRDVQLLYTDTDSFIIEVKTDYFYTDMKKNIGLYDTSDYPADNVYGVPLLHKKIPGLFKDELNSELLTHFVGLRSKMYSILSGNDEKMKKAKGVKKYVLKKYIEFNDYLACIAFHNDVELGVETVKQNSFRTKQHRKVALSGVFTDDNIYTFAYGNYNGRINHSEY